MGEREAAIGLLEKESEELKAALAAAEIREGVLTEAANGPRPDTELEKVRERPRIP